MRVVLSMYTEYELNETCTLQSYSSHRTEQKLANFTLCTQTPC